MRRRIKYGTHRCPYCGERVTNNAAGRAKHEGSKRCIENAVARDSFGKKGGTSANAGKSAAWYNVPLPNGQNYVSRSFTVRQFTAWAGVSEYDGKPLVTLWPTEEEARKYTPNGDVVAATLREKMT